MRKLFVLFLTLAALSPMTALRAAGPAEAAVGSGTVNSVDAAAGKVNIRHEAIPALKWSAMTMDFKVTDKKLLADLKPGSTVRFGLVLNASGQYVISRLEPAK